MNKPGKLTPHEMQQMKLHTTQGYYMVKELPHVPLVVMLSVLQHHERMDGSGYPLRLREHQIHPFSRIISVADIYDAMTSDRVYKRRTTPYHVFDDVFSMMFCHLDTEVCSMLLNKIRDFMTGNMVLLSDGRQARIVYPGIFPTGLPLVETADGHFINLEQKRDVSILGLISA